jgi:Tetracyclin repressor-like, C-terminal domain
VRGLDERAALHLTKVGVVILAGLWPFSNPTPAIIEANADPRLADAHVNFPQDYADMLGLAARGLLSRP